MADKPIGQLPVSAGLDDNSLLVTEQGGEARSITGALVKQFAKDAVAEETAKAEQAAKDAAAAKTSVDASKASVDQSKSSIDQTKAAIDGIKTDIDTAKDAIDQAQTDVAKNKTDAEAAAQSAGTSATIAAENAGRVAAALNEADGIVEEVTGLRDEAMNTVKSSVLFTEQQLTDEQKSQARENIGAVSADEVAQTDYEENDETSPAYLKNRPFFDKAPSGTVKWDEENEPVAVVEYGGSAELNVPPSHLYLMPRTTDHVPTYEELETLGGSVTYQTGANDFDDSGMIPVLATYKFGAGNGNLDPIIFAADVTGNATWVGTQVLVVHEANTPLENVVIEKPGVYFASDLLGGSYFYPTRAIEMTLTGGTLDDGLERLPEKFLPDSVATKEYVDQKLEEGGGADLSEILEEVDVGTVWESDGQTVEFETAGGVPVYKLPNSIAPLLTQTVKFTGGVISSSGDKVTAHEREKVPPANNISAVATSYDLGSSCGLFVVVSEDASVTIDSSSNGINEETFEMKQGVYFFGVYSLYWHQRGKTAWYALQFADSYTAEKLKPAYLPSTAATKQYVDEKATWENLKGKPTIFEGGDTLTWDGDTTGKVNANGFAYKVSDVVPALSDFANGGTFAYSGADSGSVSFTSADILDFGNALVHSVGMFLVVLEDNSIVNDFVYPEKGIYFISDGGVYGSALTIPGYTGFDKEVIDPDYLPESVKGGSGGVVYVNFTTTDGNNYTSDKTFAEVDALISAGQMVIGTVLVDGMFLTYLPVSCYITGQIIMFGAVTTFTGPVVEQIEFDLEGGVVYTRTFLAASTS